MKKEVGVFEAKTHLSKLIDEIEQTQQPILITRHGVAVAELAPVKSGVKKRKFGCAGSPDFYMAPDFDEPLAEFADYMLTDGEIAVRALRAAERPVKPRGSAR